nr:hypothetical protein [uncultured Blautia sp.]
MRDWKKLKETDIRTVNREELVDITKLEFGCLADNPDRKMRMKEFVEQVGNPYCFLVGDIVVKSTFTEGAGLKQRLQELAEGL